MLKLFALLIERFLQLVAESNNIGIVALYYYMPGGMEAAWRGAMIGIFTGNAWRYRLWSSL